MFVVPGLKGVLGFDRGRSTKEQTNYLKDLCIADATQEGRRGRANQRSSRANEQARPDSDAKKWAISSCYADGRPLHSTPLPLFVS